MRCVRVIWVATAINEVRLEVGWPVLDLEPQTPCCASPLPAVANAMKNYKQGEAGEGDGPGSIECLQRGRHRSQSLSGWLSTGGCIPGCVLKKVLDDQLVRSPLRTHTWQVDGEAAQPSCAAGNGYTVAVDPHHVPPPPPPTVRDSSQEYLSSKLNVSSIYRYTLPYGVQHGEHKNGMNRNATVTNIRLKRGDAE